MSRISGVNIPVRKVAPVALTSVYGIGLSVALEICAKVGIQRSTQFKNLTEEQVTAIRECIEKDYLVEGDLRRSRSTNIKRLMDLACYRGLRHRKHLPVRGQRTRTNARTHKGPTKPITGKK